MKRTINGKIYDTKASQLVAEYTNGLYPDDFDYLSEDLYRTADGEFFIDGEGGARTQYSVHTGRGWRREGERLIPVTEEEARAWASDRFTPEEVNKMFSQPRSRSL